MLCFWNGFSGSLLYAYVTYVGMSMCYTLVGVPYGALNSSLTRNTDEITILTSVRMVPANLAGLIIKTLPLIIAIFALTGLALLFFCFFNAHEKAVMDKDQSEGVKASDLWMELVRNRPLRVLSIFFLIAFSMMSISNATFSSRPAWLLAVSFRAMFWHG